MAAPCYPQRVCHQFTVNLGFFGLPLGDEIEVMMLQYATLNSKGGTSPYLKGEVTLGNWFLVKSLRKRTKFSSWE